MRMLYKGGISLKNENGNCQTRNSVSASTQVTTVRESLLQTPHRLTKDSIVDKKGKAQITKEKDLEEKRRDGVF